MSDIHRQDLEYHFHQHLSDINRCLDKIETNLSSISVDNMESVNDALETIVRLLSREPAVDPQANRIRRR